jgi:hypothetical protein
LRRTTRRCCRPRSGTICKKDFAYCYDPVRRKVIYNIGLYDWQNNTVTNTTGLSLWDGAFEITAGSTYDNFKENNFVTAELDIDTRAVTFYPAFNTTYLTPSGVGGVPAGAARYVDAINNYWTTPRLIDPRTGNTFVHVNGTNIACTVYFLERAKSFAMAISPWPKLSGFGTDSHMELVGMTASYTYAINKPKMLLTPRTAEAAEIAADYKSTYAYFDFPFNRSTQFYRICFDLAGNHYVVGVGQSGTRNYTLQKFVEPSATVIGGGGTVGGGYTDITPWTSTTGPNTSVAGYTLNSTNSAFAQGWNKIVLMYLPATNELAMVTKFLPADKTNLSTDPSLLRFDCTYVDLGAGTFDYHEGFITGFMKADWTSGTDENDSAYVVRDLLEVNSDLNAHGYDFRTVGRSYVRRQFFAIVQPIVGATYTPFVNGSASEGVSSFNHIVILTYDFISGAPPVLVSIQDEALWTGYGYVGANPMADLLTDWHDNAGDAPVYLASGFFDEPTQAWFWLGDDNMPTLDTAYADRLFVEDSLSLFGTAFTPFLRITSGASPAPPSASGPVMVRSFIDRPQLRRNIGRLTTPQAQHLPSGAASYQMLTASLSVSLSTQSGGLARGLRLVGAVASLTITYPAARVDRGSPPLQIGVAVKAFTFAGQAAGLKWGRKLGAVSQSITFTGEAAGLTRSSASAPNLYAAPQTLALTPEAAVFRLARRLGTTFATVTLTRGSAGLLYQSPAHLPAVVKTFSLGLQAAVLRRTRKMAAAYLPVTFTGEPATLSVSADPWSLAWSTDFGGVGFPIANTGISGFMSGSEASYGLGSTTGWMPRNRFANGEPKGSFEDIRWAYYPDPNYGYGGGYSATAQFAISGGKLRIRAEPTPAALLGLIPNRTWHFSDTGIPDPWVSGQCISLGYVEMAKTFKVECRQWHQKGKASFPAFWLLQSTWEQRLNEIDVMEAQGDQPANSSTALHGATEFFAFPDRGLGDLTTGYHVWGFVLEGGVAYWYLDGTQIASASAAASFSRVPWYLILTNAMLDWDDYGVSTGGGPDTSASPYPTQNPSDLLVDYIKVYSKSDTRLSGRTFSPGGSTAWIRGNIAATAPALDMNFTGSQFYAYGANTYQETVAVKRSDVNTGDVGWQLKAASLGASMSRRGLWVIDTYVPTVSHGPVLSVGDIGDFLYATPTQVKALVSGGTDPSVTHGRSAGQALKIALYVGSDLGGSKLSVNGSVVASGSSFPPEYMGEHSTIGISSDLATTNNALVDRATWYDLATYPGDTALRAAST